LGKVLPLVATGVLWVCASTLQPGVAWAKSSTGNGCGSGTELVRVGIGGSHGQVGISTAREANPEGPMSFDLGEKGEIYVLDQVNNRIQVFLHNSLVQRIPIPGDGVFMDLAVLPGGKVALLDNLVKKALYVLDSGGRVLGVLPLSGRGIPLAEEVVGIYAQLQGKWGGIWADLGDRSVRLAGLDGSPDLQRVSVPGRFSPDGKRVLRAERLGDKTVAVYRSEEEKFSQWREHVLSLEGFVESIWELREDSAGRIFLALGLLDEKDSPVNAVVVVDPGGKPLGRVDLCVTDMPHEIHRSIRISPQGEIFQMGLDKGGFFLKRFSVAGQGRK
jgi:hypothetical protein